MSTEDDTDRLDAVDSGADFDSEDTPGCPICDATDLECEHLALTFVPGEGVHPGLAVCSTLAEAAERITPDIREKSPRRTARPRVAAFIPSIPSTGC